MIYVYIGAALLVALLIGLTSLSIIWLSKRVNAGLKSKSIELLSSYDIKLEEKAIELAKIQEGLESKAKTIENNNNTQTVIIKEDNNDSSQYDFLNAIQRVGSTTYREKEVFDIYRKIKNSFVASPENVSRVLDEIKLESNNNNSKKVLQELNYETVYELSTLPVDTQKELLKECFDEDGIKLLNEYELTHDNFSALAFYDFLKEQSDDLNNTPIVYVSNYDIDKKYPNNIVVRADNSICEGFVVKVGNKVYDYSIKENEMI